MDPDPQIIEFLEESNAIEKVWDAKSLKYALNAWNYLIQWNKLTRYNILITHTKLMRGKLDKQELGAWRRCSVWIGGHEAKPWYAVPSLMDFWIKEANKLPKTEEEIKQDHIQVEAVHPMRDGNGRLFRLIMNWQRIKSGLPILIIKEKEKVNYYSWFE